MFSESVNRCQWSRNGLHFAAGGGEGVLSVYNFDPEAVKAELFASYSCGNDILALDWSYAAGAASSELLLYGMQGGGLGSAVAAGAALAGVGLLWKILNS